MRDIIVSIFGEYEVLIVNDNLVGGLAGLDYEWLAGLGLFAISLFSLFKLLGVLLNKLI